MRAMEPVCLHFARRAHPPHISHSQALPFIPSSPLPFLSILSLFTYCISFKVISTKANIRYLSEVDFSFLGSIVNRGKASVSFTVDPNDFSPESPANLSRHFVGFQFQAGGCVMVISARNDSDTTQQLRTP